MRLVKSIATVLLAASFAVSFAQQEEPPAPSRTEPEPRPAPPPPAAPDEDEAQTPAAPGENVDEEFIPTEELQPDAAVTFPVDI